MNTEEFLAYILADDNQLRDLGSTNIKLQPDNTPRTLNDVMETHVQQPQKMTSLPNIDNKYLSRQQSSEEMSFEEFLISLGVVRAPSQASYPQQAVQDHRGAIGMYLFSLNNVKGNISMTMILFKLKGSSLGNLVPLGVPRNETNRTTQHDPLMNVNVRRRRRMIHNRQQVCDRL